MRARLLGAVNSYIRSAASLLVMSPPRSSDRRNGRNSVRSTSAGPDADTVFVSQPSVPPRVDERAKQRLVKWRRDADDRLLARPPDPFVLVYPIALPTHLGLRASDRKS